MTTKTTDSKVKLQINGKGAWRDVLSFDIDASVAVQAAAANLVMLADPAGKTALRIATADALQTALTRWDSKKGWVLA